jgi:capsular polysaccharide biosynthesis protein
MELRRYLNVLRRRWLLLLASTICGIVAAYLTLPSADTYTAETTIYVGYRQFGGAGALSADQTNGVQQVARTFAVMIASEPIARDAVQRTGINASSEQVARRTTAAVIPGTSLIRITFRDADPARARALANAISDSLVEKVQTFEPGAVGEEGEVPILPAYVFARADLPVVPEGNGAMGRLMTGAVFGFVLAAGVAFLLDYLDITPRSADDLERHLGLPVLGVVPELPGSSASRTLGRAQAPGAREPEPRTAGARERTRA